MLFVTFAFSGSGGPAIGLAYIREARYTLRTGALGTESYADKGEDEILERAGRLTGMRLGDIDRDLPRDLRSGAHHKGEAGRIIETGYFGIAPNSSPEPDFRRAGMELKVAPLIRKKGKLRSKERMVLGIMDYERALEDGFDTFGKKGSHILMVFYEWTDPEPICEYRVAKVVDWRPTAEELRVIREDWGIIEGYIRRGEAHLLSERHTRYLSACTKGAGRGRDMVGQPNSDVPARRRALSFKASFMTATFHDRPDLNEAMRHGATECETLFTEEWPEAESFDTFVLRRINKYAGMTCAEIEGRLGVYVNPDQKAYYSALAMRMLGVRTKRVKELEQAGIQVKTVRIKTNGTPKEDTPFKAFRMADLAVEDDWEDSELFGHLDRRFMFVVFGFPTEEVEDVPRKDLVFKEAFFWSMPDDDLQTAEDVWRDTRDKIRAGDLEHFVASSDDMIVHVRPHAQNKKDVDTYNGLTMVKKCFWLNKPYIKQVIADNLKTQRRLTTNQGSIQWPPCKRKRIVAT